MDTACSYYTWKCSSVITHTITKIYYNISCNVVYLQLYIECRNIVCIAAALHMSCCNVAYCVDVYSYIQLITHKYFTTELCLCILFRTKVNIVDCVPRVSHAWRNWQYHSDEQAKHNDDGRFTCTLNIYIFFISQILFKCMNICLIILETMYSAIEHYVNIALYKCCILLLLLLLLQVYCSVIDIDECLECYNDCHYNARCTNTLGGYTCECYPGYEGNGTHCIGRFHLKILSYWMVMKILILIFFFSKLTLWLPAVFGDELVPGQRCLLKVA